MDEKEITAEQFKEATGFDPQDDDLERCNCPHAGDLMHSCCGWNKEENKPQFLLGPKYNDPNKCQCGDGDCSECPR